MALDIKFGDLLVLDEVKYPVKGIERWGMQAGAGMLDMMTATASTERAPMMTGGKRGAAVAHLSGLVCTPLLPVTAELEPRVLPNAVQAFEVFVDDSDSDAVVRVVVEYLAPTQ